MEKLNNAYDIVSKYGISLYNFGPYLSFIKNKVGICLDIKDSHYGFLIRNFSFNNMFEFEEFIKKYAYYKRVLKSESQILIEDYNGISPKITYEFEKEELLKLEKEQKEIELIKKESKGLLEYVENIYKDRIEELILRDKIRMNMENLLSEYKKNLHAFYNKVYNEKASNILDDTLNKYQNNIKNNLDLLKKMLNELERQIDLLSVKKKLKKIIMFLKTLECDETYFNMVYDKILFENKVSIIEKMNEKIIAELNINPRISPKELKLKLEDIKNSFLFNDIREDYLKRNIEIIEEKYNTLFNIEEYNFNKFLKKEELIEFNVSKENIEKKHKKINNYIYDYNKIDDENKNILLLLFSPFKKIIKYILLIKEDKNKLENFEDFESLYQELLEIVNMSDNLIIKEKYLRKINFNSFELFINSLIQMASQLENLFFIVQENEYYYSNDNLENELIFASRETIKLYDEVVNCLLLQTGSKVLYSKYRMRVVHNTLVIEENNDIFILKNKNNFIDCKKVEQVKHFKPFFKNMVINNKSLNIVTNIIENGTCLYKNWVVEVKDENY